MEQVTSINSHWIHLVLFSGALVDILAAHLSKMLHSLDLIISYPKH